MPSNSEQKVSYKTINKIQDRASLVLKRPYKTDKDVNTTKSTTPKGHMEVRNSESHVEIEIPLFYDPPLPCDLRLTAINSNRHGVHIAGIIFRILFIIIPGMSFIPLTEKENIVRKRAWTSFIT